MTKQEAINIGSNAGRDAGYDMQLYSPSAKKTGDSWQVQFNPSKSAKTSPGDFFTVFIDGTGKVERLVPGK
jgi:hypothetical protein